MAHERLSPRQKMIGMMYLVLTAMLALNVSKEAVEAFKKVEKGLSLTVANYAAKNSEIYDAFDQQAQLNPVKSGPFRDKAYEVKEYADGVFNYLQDLKVEIIKKAEGDDTKSVRGNYIVIDSVERYDDNNVPSEILIGANENGKAFALKTMINEYRNFLTETLNGKNKTIEDGLLATLNTDDGKDPGGDPERWENLTFHTLPLVAAITMLSKIQVDVRNAETDVLTFLYDQIDKRSFKFNRLVPTVTTNSTYVMQGNEYEAQVFFSAVDTTQVPTVNVGAYSTSTDADGNPKYEMTGDFATLPTDESGKGIYKLRATSIGQKSWGGLISMKAPDGTTISHPFKATYEVGAPNVVVSPTAMNVLYLNIDNPIDISVPGVGPEKIRATMKNGTIGKGQVKNSKGEFFPGNWIANPAAEGQNAQIIVSAEINGKQQTFSPMEFRVRRVPDPVASFANKQGEGEVTRGEILAQQAVFAVLKDFDFDLRFNVTEFTLSYDDKGFNVSEASTNNRVTDKQKEILSRLTRGKKLYVEKIKAVGPDKKVRDLSPIIIRVN